jgi:multiple sugar transport system permease protein
MFTFKKYAYYFVMPALAIIAIFALYPVVNSLIISLLHLDLHRPGMRFAGLANYRAVFDDPRAGLAFYHTFLFTVATVALELVFGMLLALFLQKQFRGVGAARALAMVPWAMPSVVAALLWRWIFNDEFGLLNVLLMQSGISKAPLSFLSSPFYSSVAIIACEVWKTTPFMAILLLAGLQLIPNELYESALVDGAGVWQRFRYVTLPLVKPALLIALLFRTMDALRIFDTVYILTGGGPGNSTETISLYTYKTMFSYLDMGLGAAMAMLMFVTVAAVSLLYLTVLRRVE